MYGEIIAFLGLLCGVLARTFEPYLRKMWQGTVEAFDRRFFLSMIAGFILSLFIAFQAAPEMMVVVVNSSFMVFSVNFAIGWAFNGMANELIAWFRQEKATEGEEPSG